MKLKELFPEKWIPTSLDTDDLVGHKVDYLDEGFIQLVDRMGDDMAIADGARTSFRSSAEEYSEKRNKGLIRYLIEHRHTSPLELPSLQFRVKIPLFVRAQHVRHRTQSCNWESQRYQKPDGSYYVPPVERLRCQDTWNKQGSGHKLPENAAQQLRDGYLNRCETSWKEYIRLVEDVGLSRETARDCLHPNFYSTGIFSMKLHNMFHYLKLRNDDHAQPEIHLFAHILELFVEELFPMAYEAWVEFDKEAITVSKSQYELLKFLINDMSEMCYNYHVNIAQCIKEDLKHYGSKRRIKDFVQKFMPTLLEYEDSREILLGD